MKEKTDVWQGTLALMVLKTLETMGPLHGYGIARRIEQTSGDRAVAQLRHALPGAAEARAGRLHRRPSGASPTTTARRSSTGSPSGQAGTGSEERDWQRAHDIMARFSALQGESS